MMLFQEKQCSVASGDNVYVLMSCSGADGCLNTSLKRVSVATNLIKLSCL